MLLQIENVLAAEELQAIRTALASAPFVDGRVTAGHQSALVKRNLQLPETAPLTRELGQRVLDALRHAPLFMSAALPRRIYPPLFNRYEPGMDFGNHVDNAIRGQADPMRTDISATLFLSDPRDYDGGELIIDDTYGAHSVKLAAGNLILYPASSLHRVMPVTRGVRLASFFWVQSMVRDPIKRAILFDMDTAIQSLNARVAAPELVSLTGCYHNLLRLWAEM